MDIQNVIDTIVENVTVDGIVNIDALNEIISGLKNVASAEKKLAKERAKDEKEALQASQAELGKEYYNSLADGAVFSYKTSDGTIHEARKITTKSKTGATAACELINPPATAKTTKRYPKFHQVIIPSSVEDTEAEIA